MTVRPMLSIKAAFDIRANVDITWDMLNLHLLEKQSRCKIL